ncbi:MAG: UDP-N-acetylglucosamine 2-epimerase (non-hydrolyzing) [Terriglobia bacterium]
MRILAVVGTRPNFVKIAPLLDEMSRHPDIKTILVHTGQHYDYEMSRAFFDDLDIPKPHVNLEVGSGTAVAQTAEIMLRLERVMEETQPDLVVVVGDVNSTLSAALAAAKMGLPLAHVEAGLRSFDRSMPEEINRVLTDALADFLFVTEPSGVENLLREGRPAERIYLVGNVMIDALRRFLPRAKRHPLPHELQARDKSRLDLVGPYGLVTLHRPSTVDNLATFRAIWAALEEIAKEVPLIFPVHPRTQNRMEEGGLRGSWQDASDGIHLVPPMGYLEFLRLQSEATLVITDSGGVQEETTALGIPCLTVRENTERPITLTEGTNLLVGLDGRRLVEEARKIVRGEGKKGNVPKLWDGHASTRIVRALLGAVIPAKAEGGNAALIAGKEVHTEGTEVGSQRARRKSEIFSVPSVAR